MNRQEELIRILLKSEKPLTTTELAEMLDVSSRTIRSDLAKFETELLVHHLCLEKKPHVGVWIQGAKEDKVALFLNVDQQNSTVNIYSKDYRIGCILVQILLGNSKIYPDKFADELYASRSTIEKDLSAVSKWLEKHQLELSRNANNGLYVKGNEENIRNAVGSLANDLNTRNLSIESFLETYLNVDFKKIEDIVSEWNEKYGMNLNEMNINNLAFHASIMVIRILKNKELEMSDCDELQEESHSYKEGFEQLIYELSEYIHSDIPKAESNYLLMHLFGMYLNEPAFIKNDFLSELRTLAENISDDFICNLDKIVALNLKQNKMFKQSLVLHLFPTVYRLKYGFNLYNPLLGEIKTNYAGSFSLATIINSSFEKFLNVTVSEEEIAYVALHISVAVEQPMEKQQVAIVCTMGVGVSRFLSVKLQENFPNITFIHCSSEDSQAIENCNYILSTVKLSVSKPYLQINPLLNETDIQRIRTFIYGNPSVNKNNFSLQTVMVEHGHTDRLTVLQEMTNRLQLCGAVTPYFLESVLKREAMGSTEVGNGIILTHGFHEAVKRTQIAFYKLDNPIFWNTQKVNFIVLLAVAKVDAKNVMQMSWLYKTLNSESIIEQVHKCSCEKELYELLINASKNNE